MEPISPALAGKKIIIVGAGIAGLAFVIALRKKWPDGFPFPEIVIYERDSKEVSIEREGYSISIRGDAYSGGMQVLENMGILEKALEVAVHTGDADGSGFGVWDLNFNRILDFGHEPGMRIARNDLRQLLVDNALDVPGVHIRWSTPCNDVKVRGGKVTVLRSDGEPEEADILIAADGANSKVRAALRPDDQLSYAGAVSISGTTSEVSPPVDRNWGVVVGGGGTGLFVSPIDSSKSLWSLSYLSDEPREKMTRPYSDEQVDSLLQEALDRGKHFTEPFQSMVKKTDPSTLMLINAMDKQPFPHSDPECPVIFIGDSNHAVSPFAGNGANMALMDGQELGFELSKSQSLSAAMEAYDKSSIPRSQSALTMSHRSISMAHATGLTLFLYKAVLRFVAIVPRWRC